MGCVHQQTVAAFGVLQPCSLRHRHRQPFSVPNGRQYRVRSQPVVTASLDQTTALAVTQQELAFVAVLLAEGLFTRFSHAEPKGRPSLFATSATAAAIVAAVALVNSEQQTPGLVVGVVVGFAALLQDIKRAVDVEGSAMDWPGPKAWPVGMALLSFFATSIFIQALAVSA